MIEDLVLRLHNQHLWTCSYKGASSGVTHC